MSAVVRGIGASLLLLFIVGMIRWPSLVVLGIQHGLNGYAKTIRACDRSLQEKERLLDRLDAVEERLNDGATPSFFDWVNHDEAIRAMLNEGITAEEVRLIERELQKVERELEPIGR